jgi:hypothetical protein
MNEHPILFSPEMVCAILDGRKTQTRRVVKGTALDWLQPGMFTPKYVASPENYLSPYGYSNDRLWVRERWAHDDPDCLDVHCGNRDHIWWYANEEKSVADSFAGSARWRPSIHMPRWASRITLEIVNVHIEHIQDMLIRAKENGTNNMWSEFFSEGIPQVVEWNSKGNVPTPASLFIDLWNSINARRGYGWDENPWVWVIEFKRVGDTNYPCKP